MPEKTGSVYPLEFFYIHSIAKHQKNEGGDPLKSGTVCYAEKLEKHFWFSCVDQMLQFETLKFCRTIKNYFGLFVWIGKSHNNSRVSLHEAPTKNSEGVDI